MKSKKKQLVSPWFVTPLAQKIISALLLLVILYNVGNVLISHWSLYGTRNYWQSFSNLKLLYNSSQYVNKHPKGWIPDETVNSYAAGAYVRGVGPHLIAPDTPPLGRYIIGFSAIVFNNQNESVLLFMVLSLLFMFLLGMQIFKNVTIALIPVALFTIEPIFQNQLIYVPLLDIFQLAFLLGGFYFFNKSVKGHSLFYFLLCIFLIGCFMATKFFITGLIILIAMGLLLMLRRNYKNFFLFLLLSPVSFLVLLASYLRVFAYGYSIKAFLGIQKWVFLYHKSQLILPFSIWPLILLNRWYVWYGNKPVISDGQWRITWPIVLILSLVTIVMYVLGKIRKNPPLEVLMLWSVCYILFFSFGQITSRYLVIYLPVLYIIAIFGLWETAVFLYTQYRK